MHNRSAAHWPVPDVFVALGGAWTVGCSFEDCCDVIFTDIDHGTVRKAVKATIERGDFNIRDLVFWLR